jgi:hypothetical protein
MTGKQDYLPGFGQGFACCAAESEYPDLRNGLVGAWIPTFGPTGTALPDFSPNRNFSPITGNPTWAPGGITWASTLYAQCSQPLNVQQFTILADILPTNLSGGVVSQHVICQPVSTSWGGPYARYALRIETSTRGSRLLVGWVQDGNPTQNYAVGATSLTAGVRYCVALRYDGSELSVWINGVVDGCTAIRTAITPSAYGLILGNMTDHGWGFVGPIYSIQVHSIALSPAQMRFLSADPLAPFRLRRTKCRLPFTFVPPPQSRVPYRRVLASVYGVSP